MATEALQFDENGLHILLSDIGCDRAFHWSFYLATAGSSGYVIHMTFNEEKNTWVFEEIYSTNVATSDSLLAAVKIAAIEPDSQHHLISRLRSAKRNLQALTCRTWLLNALGELDDEGYISLIESVRYIEAECIGAAVNNKAEGIKSMTLSSGCRA